MEKKIAGIGMRQDITGAGNPAQFSYSCLYVAETIPPCYPLSVPFGIPDRERRWTRLKAGALRGLQGGGRGQSPVS
jgi:hypothetical protein